MLKSAAENFLLLIHHPQKSKFLISENIRRVGLIGAILLDLSIDNVISIESKRIKTISSDTDRSSVHNEVLQQVLSSKKPRKIKTWISKLSRRSKKYQKEILLKLQSKGVVEIEEKKFLFIEYYKSRLINSDLRIGIVNELRDVIFNDGKIDEEKSAMLGLIMACGLHKTVCLDRREIKICKSKLKEIVKSDLISQGVNRVIKDMQAAIIGAVAASSAGAIVVSSN